MPRGDTKACIDPGIILDVWKLGSSYLFGNRRNAQVSLIKSVFWEFVSFHYFVRWNTNMLGLFGNAPLSPQAKTACSNSD